MPTKSEKTNSMSALTTGHFVPQPNHTVNNSDHAAFFGPPSQASAAAANL